MPESSIIAVGNEILRGFTLDTNSHWLAGRLFGHGYPARWIEVVGDDTADIVAVIRREVLDTDIARIFVCGGLGPTPDDRTAAALAEALGRPLTYDRRTGAQMQDLLFSFRVARSRGTAELNPGNRKMATLPQGATLLRNGPGMAPGLVFELGGDRILFALPGVPHELRQIFDEGIAPRYLSGGTTPAVREIRYRGAPESAFHDALAALEREYPDVSLGSYPQAEPRQLVLRASGPDLARVEAVLCEIRRRVAYQPVDQE